MKRLSREPTQRFSDRADNYARFRPRYPDTVLQSLRNETGLTSTSVVADVGSGTGISSELFLRHGNRVYAVEPNSEMRHAAEALLSGYPGFHSVAGTAEATSLPARSVDYVLAAQAFHWFDRAGFRKECLRILQPGGWVVLLWNTRRVESTAFMQAYEEILRRHGTDYEQVHHRKIDAGVIQELYARGRYARRVLYTEQRLDLEGLKGRLLSSSYTPTEGHPDFAPMMSALEETFEEHETEGHVCLEYDTEVYFGHVG